MATKNVKSAFLSTRTSVTPHFMSYHTARDEISELISREHGVHVSYIQPKTVATERSFHGRTCSAFALRRIADKTSPEIRPKACGVIFCVQFVRHIPVVQQRKYHQCSSTSTNMLVSRCLIIRMHAYVQLLTHTAVRTHDTHLSYIPYPLGLVRVADALIVMKYFRHVFPLKRQRVRTSFYCCIV